MTTRDTPQIQTIEQILRAFRNESGLMSDTKQSMTMAQALAVIQRLIEEGVIGEDIEPVQDSDVLYAAGVAANAIRNEQRKALQTTLYGAEHQVTGDKTAT